jgi:hypothetical protein
MRWQPILLSGLVLRTDAGEQVLTAGTCAGFPAGSGNAHQLVNRSNRPARYLEISNRDPEDSAEYPDVDLAYGKAPDGSAVFHQQGRGAMNLAIDLELDLAVHLHDEFVRLVDVIRPDLARRIDPQPGLATR